MGADRPAAGEAAVRALRLIEEVQAFGLGCAAAVADRYVQVVDRYLDQRGDPAGARTGEAGDATLLEVGERMAQAWSRSAEVVATALAQAAASPGEGSPEPVLHLPPVRPGESSTGRLWVHNPTPDLVTVTIRASIPVNVDGGSLPPVSLVLEPDGSLPVEAGGAAEVRVRVLVPRETSPGHFHALLTSTATPSQALGLHVEVLAEEGPV